MHIQTTLRLLIRLGPGTQRVISDKSWQDPQDKKTKRKTTPLHSGVVYRWKGGGEQVCESSAPPPSPPWALRALADCVRDCSSSSGDDLQVLCTRGQLYLQTQHLLASICMNKPVTVQSQSSQVLHMGPVWYPRQEPWPKDTAPGP